MKHPNLPSSNRVVASRVGAPLLAFTLGAASGCGARAGAFDELPADPLWVLTPGEGACPATQDSSAATGWLLDLGPGERIAVADMTFASTCSGFPSSYVVARDVDTGAAYWLGAEGCDLGPTPNLAFGYTYAVVRWRPSSSTSLAPSTCVGFPNEPPGLTTEAEVLALGVFETLGEARAFAAEGPL